MRKSSKWVVLSLLVVTLIATVQLTAQYSGRMSLGRSTLYSVPTSSLALREATPLRMARAAYFFEVGGVTFEGVARPRPGTVIGNLSLTYQPTRPDGQRLIVTIDGQQLIAPVFDWQFIPAARFAASPYTACFTLFGNPDDLNNASVAEYVEQNYGRVIKFAPAFKNTLVGLRLMQLDMLIISPDAVELPQLNSRYILGAGESQPDLASNSEAAKRISSGLERFDGPGQGRAFESYVINDQRSPVYIGSAMGYLTLSGTPSYYTFKIRGRDTDAPAVVPNTRLNDWLASQTDNLRNINPDVWDNAVTTARYSAFFRYAKQNSPQSWGRFLTQIAGVQLVPSVTTPDVIIDPREKEMADLAEFIKKLQESRRQQGTRVH